MSKTKQIFDLKTRQFVWYYAHKIVYGKGKLLDNYIEFSHS